MSDTQTTLKAAWERFNARNMFIGDCGMFECLQNVTALRLAQIACWKAGECCGEQGDDGQCKSRVVRLDRHLMLLDAGVSLGAAGKLSEYCEHCPQFAEMASVYEFDESDQGQSLAGRLWANRFIQYYGDGDNGNGVSESGQGEESQGTGDNDGIGKGNDTGTHSCGAWPD
jgi:hypothetical protein